MKAKHRQKQKFIDKYNATDLYDFWCKEYFQQHNEQYEPRVYKGLELQKLAVLLGTYDVFSVCLGIIKEVTDYNSGISWFCDSFHPSYDRPKLTFYVHQYGDEQQKQLLSDLLVLDDIWSLSSEVSQKKVLLTQQLQEWLDIVV